MPAACRATAGRSPRGLAAAAPSSRPSLPAALGCRRGAPRLELAVAASPGLVAARRLAAATASAAAVTSLLALSAAVYGGLRHLEA